MTTSSPQRSIRETTGDLVMRDLPFPTLPLSELRADAAEVASPTFRDARSCRW
jgi:hypothetical protein